MVINIVQTAKTGAKLTASWALLKLNSAIFLKTIGEIAEHFSLVWNAPIFKK